jgi:peptidoglycan hydrolase CwlO-like protein
MDSLSIDNIVQFVVLLGGIFASFIRFNNKTEKNAIMITQLEKDIKNVKEDNEKNYTKLEAKISEVENDLKSIASDIGEIKGFIKQLRTK